MLFTLRLFALRLRLRGILCIIGLDGSLLRLSGRALLLIIVVILVFGIVVTTDALTLLRLFLWSRCLYRWLYTSCFEFADQFGRQFYFSVGRSSMGMKSLSALTGSGISSLGSVTSVLAVFPLLPLLLWEFLLLCLLMVQQRFLFLSFFCCLFPSALVLRGRPGLRLVDSVVSSVSFVLSTVGWAGTTAVFQW